MNVIETPKVIKVQVVNKTKTTFNQFETTQPKVIKDIKARGWSISDCTVSEIRPELLNTSYRTRDGKNGLTVRKQYRSRAQDVGTLNNKVV